MIKLFDPVISPDSIKAVEEVLQTGWVGLGPKTEEFEKAFAKYVGTKYAVATNSATAALHLSLAAHGLKKGDRVITTPLTFISTNHAISYLGGVPKFADVDLGTLNLSLDTIKRTYENCDDPKPKYLMLVHYGGNPCDLYDIEEFALENNITIIEDAAHACGASYDDYKIGSFNTTCFSFHAVKNLPSGDGGIVTTHSRSIYNKVKNLRWLGISSSTYDRSMDGYKWEYEVENIGWKYQMNDITAAIALEELKCLDKNNDKKRDMVRMYRDILRDFNFVETDMLNSSHHLCVIRSWNRNKLHEYLAKNQIDTSVHYKPNYHYKMYGGTTLPNTERAYKEILSVPLHLNLSHNDIIEVCEKLKAGLKVT